LLLLELLLLLLDEEELLLLLLLLLLLELLLELLEVVEVVVPLTIMLKLYVFVNDCVSVSVTVIGNVPDACVAGGYIENELVEESNFVKELAEPIEAVTVTTKPFGSETDGRVYSVEAPEFTVWSAKDPEIVGGLFE
jgi:hypothetical protein